MKNVIFSFLILLQMMSCTSPTIDDIDLSGQWNVQVLDTVMPIRLPGTLDEANIGEASLLTPELKKKQLSHLTRKHTYVGPAKYTRTICVPKSWKGRDVVLHMERILWDSQVWLDGQLVGQHEESLSTPHCYNLTSYIQYGTKQTLTIQVDNTKRYDISVKDLGHAYTDETQIIWNGILGKINLTAENKVRIDQVQLFPNIADHTVKAVVTLKNTSDAPVHGQLDLQVSLKDAEQSIPAKSISKSLEISRDGDTVTMVYDMGEHVKLWDEFHPNIYIAQASLKVGDSASSVAKSFGMRQLGNEASQMTINGKPLFLRGTLECCIFPLTGTPPMDKSHWIKVFSAAKSYGLNHLRFHSWCPPEAAFEVADEMGLYLQIELPVWSLTIGKNASTTNFLLQEGSRIIKNYGNHPSFCLWSMGNELEGDFNVLSNIMQTLKKADTRHLYTTTSFTFQKGHGTWPEADDDYFVTQWTKNGWVRGQGVFNEFSPSFDKDYEKSVQGMQVPLVTHEVGQYSVYPDLSEIDQYTGVLEPLNLLAIRNDLEKKGLLKKAPAYTQASGKLAAILYKEEIERALKTKGISGFQLLDLHDYPGQGTALVGLLNAFWQSKGIVSDTTFREFCSPIVPLLRFPKAVYKNNETFQAEIDVCNYGSEVLKNRHISWSISNKGKVIKKGRIQVDSLSIGYNGLLGEISFPLIEVEKASQLEIKVQLDHSDCQNRWSVWSYPSTTHVDFGKVKFTRDYDQALALLRRGETVLFNPDWKTMTGLEGKFVPVFWSPVHFPKQAGTMGILCDPSHPALQKFPTESHSNWQWWDLNIHSTVLITDSVQGGDPIVEVIDNFVNNRRLASLYEGQVGKGKLVLATFDLSKDLAHRPVANQMLSSIVSYMNSAEFNPKPLTNFDTMRAIFYGTLKQKQSATSIY